MSVDEQACVACGAALPDGAMFCGECGRAVSGSGIRTVPGRRTSDVARQTRPDTSARPPIHMPPAGDVSPSTLDPFVDPYASLAEAARLASAPDSAEGSGGVGSDADSDRTADGPDAEDAGLDPNSAAPDASSSDGPETEHCELCGAVLAHDDIFCPECGHVAGGVARAFSRPSDTVAITPVRSVAPGPERVEFEQVGADHANPSPEPTSPPVPSELPVPPEPTVSPNPAASLATARFVLQFSTGESVTVDGTGLIGRNPVPEPGEYFDRFVRVSDAGRSVSKTHLEFGCEEQQFWVRDRFSGNGTVVRRPDAAPLRAEPGRRVRVDRGSRIDIGDQFFVVS